MTVKLEFVDGSHDPLLPHPNGCYGGSGPYVIPIADDVYGGVIAWVNTEEQGKRIVSALNETPGVYVCDARGYDAPELYRFESEEAAVAWCKATGRYSDAGYIDPDVHVLGLSGIHGGAETAAIATGESVAIADTICTCGHWHGEHGVECDAPGCDCARFVLDPVASTAGEIANRGGDPAQWPEHVKQADERAAVNALIRETVLRTLEDQYDERDGAIEGSPLEVTEAIMARLNDGGEE